MTPRLADVASELTPGIDPRDVAAEANHRIANNLCIIAQYVRAELFSLSSEATPDFFSLRRSLQQLSLKIDAAGRLHRLLTTSHHAASVEIGTYLREIVDAARCILAHAENAKIVFSSETEALVSAKQAIAIGAITSEALVNSIKYSHPSCEPCVVSIGCRRTRYNGLLIEIKDGGAGQSHELLKKVSQCGGAGTDLMWALARGLDANLEIMDSQAGRIVRFELPLPIQPLQ